MRVAAFISIFCLSGVVGCDQQPYAQIPTDYCAHVDMKTTPPADMTVVPPCAAAIGLRGDNLVCVDFLRFLISHWIIRLNFLPSCPVGTSLRIVAENIGKFRPTSYSSRASRHSEIHVAS